jgi:hypothetical protein
MKTFIAALLLLALGNASDEHAVASEAASDSLFRRLVGTPRLLQEVSQQCLNDTADIFFNSSIEIAYAAWVAENNANLQECAAVATTDDCTLDSSTYVSYNATVAACTESGGVNYFYTTTFNCSVTINDTASDMTITFNNFVECIAPSCDLDSVTSDAYARLTLLAAIKYEERLSNITDTAMCTSEFDYLQGTYSPTWAPTVEPTAISEGDQSFEPTVAPTAISVGGSSFAGIEINGADPTSLAPSFSLNGLVVPMSAAASLYLLL